MDTETVAGLLCVVLLAAASQPSPAAVPLASFFVFCVDDAMWAEALEYIGPAKMIAFGFPLVAILTYWANGLILLLLGALASCPSNCPTPQLSNYPVALPPSDCAFRPTVLEQFRLQPQKGFDTAKIWKVVKNLLIGQVFVIVPFGLFYAHLHTKGIGLYSSEKLPTRMERFMHMIIYVILDEFAFYYGHLWLHVNTTKWWNYRRVHKIHHEFTSPVALTASYCHPIEMVISNVLPLCGGMLACGSHVYTGLVWTMFAVLGTQTHHCGYRWPWTPGFDHQPDFHDFHHEKFNTNYGLTGWCDALHGTDKMWKEHVLQRDKKRAEAAGQTEGDGPAVGSKGSNLMYTSFVGVFVGCFVVDRLSAMGYLDAGTLTNVAEA